MRSLKSFSQAYDLESQSNHIVGVNFIYEGRDLEFKVDSER